MSRRRGTPWPHGLLVALLALLAVGVPLWIGDERGGLVGFATAVFWVPMCWFAAVKGPHLTEWSREHPVLDGLVMVPLAFVGAAGYTDWPIALCVAVAAGAGIALTSLGAVLRRRRGSVPASH